MNSLKKGNLQSATFVKNGQEVKQFIEANPQFKTVTVYDAQQKRIDTRQSNTQQQFQEQDKGKKQSQKETVGTGDDVPSGGEKPKRQRSTSKGL